MCPAVSPYCSLSVRHLFSFLSSRHVRHPPLCMSELSANDEGQARAGGNCSSHFPPRCSTMAKEETLPPEDLSFKAVMCP